MLKKEMALRVEGMRWQTEKERELKQTQEQLRAALKEVRSKDNELATLKDVLGKYDEHEGERARSERAAKEDGARPTATPTEGKHEGGAYVFRDVAAYVPLVFEDGLRHPEDDEDEPFAWDNGSQGETNGATTVWGNVDKALIEALRHTYPTMKETIDELEKETGRKLIMRISWGGIVTAETADRDPPLFVYGYDVSHREIEEEEQRSAA